MVKHFVESALAGKLEESSDGTYRVVLITPGQGTSGYYRESVIASDAPAAFPKGTHVYLDHLEEGEKRTPDKILGTLVEDTKIAEDGSAVNRFKPLKKHADWIEEVRGIVGLSVSVSGTGVRGDVDGKQTMIVESLTPSITNTVDIVSYAGRGGRFLESYLEEANLAEEENAPGTDVERTKGNANKMTYSEEQVDSLIESVKVLADNVAQLTEAAKPEVKDADEDRKAAVAAVRAVESANVSDDTKARLVESIEAGNYDVQGIIDTEVALRESIREELQAEFQESAAGSSAGGKGGDGSDPYKINGWGK